MAAWFVMSCTKYFVADIAFFCAWEGVLKVIRHVSDRMCWTVDGIEVSARSRGKVIKKVVEGIVSLSEDVADEHVAEERDRGHEVFFG